jgi:hypothetical protein
LVFALVRATIPALTWRRWRHIGAIVGREFSPMKKMLVEISDEAFRRLSRHALVKDTTAEKLAARFLCGAYCADEYDDISPDEVAQIALAWEHADPDLLHTDDGVRAYYDLHTDDD